MSLMQDHVLWAPEIPVDIQADMHPHNTTEVRWMV
jgi:hypothetical protein